jgi:hypothetical protein
MGKVSPGLAFYDSGPEVRCRRVRKQFMPAVVEATCGGVGIPMTALLEESGPYPGMFHAASIANAPPRSIREVLGTDNKGWPDWEMSLMQGNADDDVAGIPCKWPVVCMGSCMALSEV